MSKPEMIYDYEIHPAASIFPLMEDHAFQSLVDSIAVHGVQNPIVCIGHVVIDGRNRLRAVMKLRDEGHDVALPAVEWGMTGGKTSVAEWVAAQNLDRRHLTDDARIMAAAAIQKMVEAEAAATQRASRFTPEKAKEAGSKKRQKTATADSPSPQKRDRKKSEASTTAGKLAAKAKTSTHKAKQAIAVQKAVDAGDVSPEVVKEIVAGKKKLKDAVPAKSKKKPTEPLASDDVASEIRTAAVKSWQRLKDRFAINEHGELRKVMADIIREEQKQAGK